MIDFLCEMIPAILIGLVMVLAGAPLSVTLIVTVSLFLVEWLVKH